jgi:diphthine-ammonia ligase
VLIRKLIEDTSFMKAIALFSGGKDSLYALYLVEKTGVTVNHLLTLIPSLPRPSPHAENLEALKLLSESMGKQLKIVDFKEKGAFVEALKSFEVDALVAGDIFVEEHVAGLNDVCSKTGLELLEPLYRRNTSEVFDEIFNLGFKALITGVNLKYLEEDWLGFVISKKTGTSFRSRIGSADPLGENGEFHTLVLDCPLYAKSFKVKSAETKSEKGMSYLKVSIV